MIKVALIDNYDSFTFNLYQAIAALEGGPDVKVLRNDVVNAESIGSYNPTHLLLSPGPCAPDQAGNSCDVIEKWAGRLPILGVCLGHQCIGQVFGGKIVRATRCMHGKTSQIHHDGETIFQNLPNPFSAMRYHSLIIDVANLDADFTVSARTDQGEIMAVRNKILKIEGVQFHPESFATPYGNQLLQNWLFC